MENSITIKQILSAWHGQNARFEKLIAKLTDEQFQQEVAPGRNRGIYLLGHIATVSDMMIPLLGLGNALRPQYQPLFVSVPDRAVKELPSVHELKAYFKEVNNALYAQFEKMTDADWLGRHTSVSEEDFAKEPHRNKLSIILSRTSHHAYHIGQVAFLQPTG